MRKISILGSGVCVPSREVTSLELDKKLGKEPGWVQNKSGVEKRYFADDSTSNTKMAAKAAIQALKEANLDIADIDCVIGACGVMEQALPNTSTLLLRELGLGNKGVCAFDINTTCLSFLSAFDMASYLISAGRFRNILIFSSDMPSLALDWSHLESSTIFGDGAAAVLLSEANEFKTSFKILSSHMETYSEGSSYCQIQGGGTRRHPNRCGEDFKKYHFFEMDGKAAYKLTASKIGGFLESLFEGLSMSFRDVDFIVPHQASLLAINHLRKKLGIAPEKVINIFQQYGNQVAASIPTALHILRQNYSLSTGQKIMIIGTGAGISLGGILLEVTP